MVPVPSPHTQAESYSGVTMPFSKKSEGSGIPYQFSWNAISDLVELATLWSSWEVADLWSQALGRLHGQQLLYSSPLLPLLQHLCLTTPSLRGVAMPDKPLGLARIFCLPKVMDMPLLPLAQFSQTLDLVHVSTFTQIFVTGSFDLRFGRVTIPHN